MFDAALNYIQFLSLCIFVYVRFSFLYFLSLLVLSDQKQAVAQRYSIKHVFLEISQIHKKTTVTESLFRPATLLKARLWHICFHVNFAKFLRTPSVTEHFRTTAFWSRKQKSNFQLSIICFHLSSVYLSSSRLLYLLSLINFVFMINFSFLFSRSLRRGFFPFSRFIVSFLFLQKRLC